MIRCRCSHCGNYGLSLLEKALAHSRKNVICTECHASGYISPWLWWGLNLVIVFFMPLLFILLISAIDFFAGFLASIVILLVIYTLALYYFPVRMKLESSQL